MQVRPSPEEVTSVIRWNARFFRAAVALAAFAALVIGSGADWRWN
jgi:hypothetical protein